jgi:teichuronic acid biosynthesis glycosyltransferase TuaC
MAPGRPRVLVLSRNYPNNVLPTLGLWTRRLVDASTRCAEPTVISPVPYAPPLLPFESLAKFRRVLPVRRDGAHDVFHPRVLIPPGSAFHRYEAMLAWPFIRRLADRLHAERRFDLIHAHFIYPDGVIAARLARRFAIPVVVTEHAGWARTFDAHPSVKSQVLGVLPDIRLILPVSSSLQRDIALMVGDRVAFRVLPNVVDEATFTPADTRDQWDPDQLLFVGLIRRVKGLDILLRALALLVVTRPRLRLLVMGGAFYRSYQRDEDDIRRLAAGLGVMDRIRFAGEANPSEVADAMRRSAVLVVPSRRETFSAVTAEAIACGTPVVATRCGGPEEIITPETGLLVRVEDPEDLAAGIEQTLDHRAIFDPHRLHQDVVARFGTAAIGRRIEAVYNDALGGNARPGRPSDEL